MPDMTIGRPRNADICFNWHILISFGDPSILYDHFGYISSGALFGNFGLAANVLISESEVDMRTFLLWLLLLFLCWPIAVLGLVLFPLVWLLLLPLRLLGIAVDGIFQLFRAVITLPARILGMR